MHHDPVLRPHKAKKATHKKKCGKNQSAAFGEGEPFHVRNVF